MPSPNSAHMSATGGRSGRNAGSSSRSMAHQCPYQRWSGSGGSFSSKRNAISCGRSVAKVIGGECCFEGTAFQRHFIGPPQVAAIGFRPAHRLATYPQSRGTFAQFPGQARNHGKSKCPATHRAPLVTAQCARHPRAPGRSVDIGFSPSGCAALQWHGLGPPVRSQCWRPWRRRWLGNIEVQFANHPRKRQPGIALDRDLRTRSRRALPIDEC